MVVVLLFLVSGAVAVHHEMPMDLQDFAAAAVCLGIAISTGRLVEAIGGFVASRSYPIVVRSPRSVDAFRFFTANTARAGPKRAGLTVIRN